MFKNYLKIAFRNIIRHKLYSFINIAGLAIGMACAILILLWVQDELSYDRFHENAEYIFRVVANDVATTPYPLAAALKSDFPEIINSARFGFAPRMALSVGEKAFYEDRIAIAEPSFFKIFSFSFFKGEPNTALSEPFSSIITESMAKKYFGEKDPLGQSILVDNMFPIKVTGIIKNVPHNSHLQFDFIVPVKILGEIGQPIDIWDQNWSTFTYVQLNENTNLSNIQEKIKDYIQKYISYPERNLRLQPLTRVHFSTSLHSDNAVRCDIKYIYIFSSIALIVLVVAFINFTNLATARYTLRLKEVGVRKVIGADRLHLIKQFIGESILFALIACIISIIIVETVLPVFNSISGKSLMIDYSNYKILLSFMAFIIVSGILSGSYPSLFLSSFEPGKILKNTIGSPSYSIKIRKMLVTLQFSLSIILIIAMLVVYSQMHYIGNKDLGFDKENLVILPMKGDIAKHYKLLKNRFLENPNIIDVAAQNRHPLQYPNIIDWRWENSNEFIQIEDLCIDDHYFNVMKIEIKQGRDFSEQYSTDANDAVILNEEAIRAMKIENPIGKQLRWYGRIRTIIGIANNAQMRSLHQNIRPKVFRMIDFSGPHYTDVALVRLKASDSYNSKRSTVNAMNYIKRVWKQMNPNSPFEYEFIDRAIDNQYNAEQILTELLTYFTALALFISCLGLFGLSTFMAERRTKEIGIRKVLGASVTDIFYILSKDFSKWVLIANIIAWPIAWYAMSKWLQNFAYRINIGWWTFILAGALALVIALLTVSYQAVKAATANPVESLRYE